MPATKPWAVHGLGFTPAWHLPPHNPSLSGKQWGLLECSLSWPSLKQPAPMEPFLTRSSPARPATTAAGLCPPEDTEPLGALLPGVACSAASSSPTGRRSKPWQVGSKIYTFISFQPGRSLCWQGVQAPAPALACKGRQGSIPAPGTSLLQSCCKQHSCQTPMAELFFPGKPPQSPPQLGAASAFPFETSFHSAPRSLQCAPQNPCPSHQRDAGSGTGEPGRAELHCALGSCRALPACPSLDQRWAVAGQCKQPGHYLVRSRARVCLSISLSVRVGHLISQPTVASSSPRLAQNASERLLSSILQLNLTHDADFGVFACWVSNATATFTLRRAGREVFGPEKGHLQGGPTC